MTKKVMGTPPEKLTRNGAAKILKVAVRTLGSYVEQGLLIPVREGRKVFFRRSEVVALLEVLREGRDLPAVTTMAMRAFIRAEICEKKLNDLLSFLGFTSIPLETSARGVLELYERAKGFHDLDAGLSDAGQVFHFAKELLAMTEEYLRLVAHHTGDGEPYAVYLKACAKIAELAPAPRLLYDHELAAAYGYVASARRHVRSLAYFYVRSEYGRDVADKSFIGDNAFDPVITTLFPN